MTNDRRCVELSCRCVPGLSRWLWRPTFDILSETWLQLNEHHIVEHLESVPATMDDDFGVVQLCSVAHAWQWLFADDLRLYPLHLLVVRFAGVKYEYVIEYFLAAIALTTTEYDEELAKAGG